MKYKRKRYQAQFLNDETHEIKSFDLFAHDDDEGTSGRGVARKTADVIAVKNGLSALWSRVIPVRVTYEWTKKDGCHVVKVEEIEETDTETEVE